jgi:opacity protein-like surface antigen
LGLRLKIGVFGTYYLMQGKNFKDTYGQLAGFGGELSFRFSPKIDFWVSGGMANKKALFDFAGVSYEMQFKLIPLAAAIRYYLLDKGKLSAFVGAGANAFMVKDFSPTGDIKTTAVGFHALGGFYYNLSKKISAQFTAKYNMVKKDLFPESTLDDKLDLSGLALMFGFGYTL